MRTGTFNRNRLRRGLAAAVIAGLVSLLAVVIPPGPAQAGAGIYAGGHFVPDNAAVREENSYVIYQVVNGGKLWIPTHEDLAVLGYTLASIYVVPAGSLGAVPSVPRDGTLIKERTQFHVYYIEDGYRFWITTPTVLEAMGYTFTDVRTVSAGITLSIPEGAGITESSMGGRVFNLDETDAVISGSGWRFAGTDVLHADSANGKARVAGGINWWSGSGLKFWLHRGNLMSGTKVYAVEPVGCIWARVSFGYPRASVTFPPAATIEGAAEVGTFYRSCRSGSETKPSAINLSGLGFAKLLLSSVTVTVCNSASAADGPRNCANEKQTYS